MRNWLRALFGCNALVEYKVEATEREIGRKRRSWLGRRFKLNPIRAVESLNPEAGNAEGIADAIGPRNLIVSQMQYKLGAAPFARRVRRRPPDVTPVTDKRSNSIRSGCQCNERIR